MAALRTPGGLSPAPRFHLALARGGPYIFALSMAFGAWLVLFRLADAPAAVDAPAVALLANVALYTLFARHHSLLARPGAKRWMRATLPAHLERTLYVWVASLLFIALCVLWQPLPGRLFRLAGPTAWALVVLRLVGAVIAVVGSRGIDLNEFMGVRETARAIGLESRPTTPEPLINSGGYRFVRHPLYSGVILLLFCAPDMTTGRFVFAGLSTLYILLAVPFEERSLVDQYGDAYREYQRQVRWRVLPWVW
jgi:methanethiol S-methyltransferase